MRKKIKIDAFSLVLFIFLTLFAVSLLYLLFWSLISSFKMQSEFRLNKLGLPQEWTAYNYGSVFDNLYVQILTKSGFPRKVYVPEMTINTLLYVFGCAFLPFSLVAQQNVPLLSGAPAIWSKR